MMNLNDQSRGKEYTVVWYYEDTLNRFRLADSGALSQGPVANSSVPTTSIGTSNRIGQLPICGYPQRTFAAQIISLISMPQPHKKFCLPLQRLIMM